MSLATLARKSAFTLVACYIGMSSGCTTEQQYPAIESNFSGPIDILAYNNLFYVLNSAFDRSYNSGSLMAIDPATQTKVSVLEVPRMGRSMNIVGDTMVVSYDRAELEDNGRVEIYKLDGAGGMTLQFAQEIDCSPINAILSPSLSYAVVSCLNGELFVSSLTSDLSATSFKLVREYAYSHRALYIYEENDQAVLLAFPTDMGDQTAADFADLDANTYTYDLTSTDVEIVPTIDPTPNEVPDIFESSIDNIRQVTERLPYQYLVYNHKEEEALGYPVKEIGSVFDEDLIEEGQTYFKYANNELKFIYYTIDNPLTDPTPDSTTGGTEDDPVYPGRFYRSNFWEAKPSGDNPNEFFLSQRGIESLGDSNNILKVTIGNSTNSTDVFGAPYVEASPGKLPPTSDILSFEQIAGATFLEKQGYPGDFEIVDYNNETFLFVNQFRDEAYWDAGTRLYAIDAKSISLEGNLQEVPFRWEGLDYTQSAYQLAVTSNGYLMACSFYGDNVILFPLDRTKGIDDQEDPTFIF